MIQRSEALTRVLSRAGPGCMTMAAVQRELAREAQGIRWSEEAIRRTAHTSDDRVRILELSLDVAANGASQPRLATWVLATEPEEGRPSDPLAHDLWRTLATLGRRVDPGSRVSLSRWMLKAEEAVALCRLLRERGPPPTTHRLRPPTSGSDPGSSSAPAHRGAA